LIGYRLDWSRRGIDNAPAAARWLSRRLNDWRWSFRCGCSCTSTTTRSRSRRRCGACTFLTLPPRANSRDLVVRQRAHMRANRHVHLTKQCDHFIDGYAEFACHVVNAKLAQTLPP
jgi:hypothetical protein